MGKIIRSAALASLAVFGTVSTPAWSIPEVAKPTAGAGLTIRTADVSRGPKRRLAHHIQWPSPGQCWQPWAGLRHHRFPEWAHVQRRYTGSYPRPSYDYPERCYDCCCCGG
jgi:hypothetical protein